MPIKQFDFSKHSQAKKKPSEPLPLGDYIRQAWQVLEPATHFVDGWHIDAVAEHLEAVTAGHIRNLIINIPPGTSKSLMVSVFWPTWEWTFAPWRRFLTGSHSQSLSTRDALKSRRLIQSDWYQSRWGSKFRLTGDQNQKMRYENDKTGFRLAVSVGGPVTGERGHVKILDDPHKADEMLSDAHRMSAIEWLGTVWSTRLNDPKTGSDIIVMQRLHEGDATGYLLEEITGYEHLVLPMRFEPERKCFTSIGFEDPRTEPGELLCEERFGEAEVKDLERRLGTYGAAGQLQQRPAPSDGGIFKRRNWRFWQYQGQNLAPVAVRLESGEIFYCPVVNLPEHMHQYAQSWDATFKGTATGSFVVGQVWGVFMSACFLLDQTRERLEFTGTLEAIRALSKAWPQALAKFIEDKANGPAIINVLGTEIPGLIPIEPQGDKVARARAIAPMQEAGNIYLPHPDNCPWVKTLIANFAVFPNGKDKDEIDAMSQIIIRLFIPQEVNEVDYMPVKIGQRW